MNDYSTLLHNNAPGKYIVIKVEYGLQLHFKIFLNKSDRKKTPTKIIIKMLMILDFKDTFTVICNRVLSIIPLHMKIIDF